MPHSVAARLPCGIVIALIVFCLPGVGAAGTITIGLALFDVTYLGSAPNGGAIFDAIGLSGAGGGFHTTVGQASELQTASFKLDQNNVGSLVDNSAPTSDDMWGDLRIDGVGGTLTRNAINFNRGNGNSGGTNEFDWFIRPINDGGPVGNFLRLALTNVNVTLIDGTQPPPGVSTFDFTGNATLISQNLPFGLAFDPSQPISFSYSAPKPGITGNDAVTTTGVLGLGTLAITGTQLIPEPASIALFCTCGSVLGIGVLRRYRKRRAA